MSVREIIFGLIFVIAGLLGFAGMIRENFDAINSENWIKIEGEIITAKLKSPPGKGAVQAVIFYVYEVNQKKIVNSRMTFSRSASASQMLEKYPLFSTVPVYYDPADPEKSVVEPGFDGAWLDCMWPLLMTLLGAYVLFLNYRKYGQVERESAI